MKKIIFLLLICQCTFGQITLTPNSMGMNSPVENNLLSSEGNGFIVQKKYTLTTADPNANINNISCLPGSPALSSLAGIVKDPNGDLPYTAGIPHNCSYNIFSNPQPFAYLITFISLDLGTGDAVNITSEFGTQSFTGNTIPQPFIVKSMYFAPGAGGFRVTFSTNTDASVGQGFVIKYQAIPDDNIVTVDFSNFKGGNSLLFDASKGSFNAGFLSSSTPRGRHSIGLGYSPKNIGNNSLSIGNYNETSGDNSVAIGTLNKSLFFNAFSFGIGNTINSINGFALGAYNTLNNQSEYAFGDNNTIMGRGAKAFGTGLNSKAIEGLVVGVNNEISDNPNPNMSDISDRIFQIGNGNSTRSNALTILRNGNTGLGNTPQTLAPDSRLVIDGLTRLGTDAPKIKMKEISGNMPAANGNNNYPHGLTDTQIFSIVVSAEVNNQFIPPNYTGNPSLEYNYYWAAGNLYILNKNGNSTGLTGVPFKALITYKE